MDHQKNKEHVIQKWASSILVLESRFPRRLGLHGRKGYLLTTGFVVCAALGLILTTKEAVGDAGFVKLKGLFSQCPVGNGRKTGKRKGRKKALTRKQRVEPLEKTVVDLEVAYIDPVEDFALLRIRNRPDLQEVTLKANSADETLEMEVMAVGTKGEENNITRVNSGRVVDVNLIKQSRVGSFSCFVGVAVESPVRMLGAPLFNNEGEVIAMMSSATASEEERSSITMQQGWSLRYGLRLSRVISVIEQLKTTGNVISGTLDLSFKNSPEGLIVTSKPITQRSDEKSKVFKGDVIHSVNGVEVNAQNLQTVLDRFVSTEDQVQLEITNRKRKEVKIEHGIDSLENYEITEFVEVSNAIIHAPPRSVHLAASGLFGSSFSGLYLADNGYLFKNAGIPNGVLLTKFGDIDLHSMRNLVNAIEQYCDASLNPLPLVPVEYRLLSSPRKKHRKLVVASLKWFMAVHWERVDGTEELLETDSSNGSCGFDCLAARWKKSDILTPTSELLSIEKVEGGSQDDYQWQDFLVLVRFSCPFPITGKEDRSHGESGSEIADLSQQSCVGIIIDSTRGFILCERATVISTISDVLIIFGGQAADRGRVVFVHPFHAFAIIQYSPREMEKHDIWLPPNRSHNWLSSKAVQISTTCSYYDFSSDHSWSLQKNVLVSSKTISEPVSLDTSSDGDESGEHPLIPANFETFEASFRKTENSLGGFFLSTGLERIIGFRIRVPGANQKQFINFPTYPVKAVLDGFLFVQDSSRQACIGLELPFTPFTFDFMSLYRAVEANDIERKTKKKLVRKMNKGQRAVMRIRSKFYVPNTPKDSFRRREMEGDVLISINSQIVTNYEQLTSSLQPKGKGSKTSRESRLTVYREGTKHQYAEFPIYEVPFQDIPGVLVFCGMTFHQATPWFVTKLGFLDHRDKQLQEFILLSAIEEGSPAQQMLENNASKFPFLLRRFHGEKPTTWSNLLNIALSLNDHGEAVRVKLQELNLATQKTGASIEFSVETDFQLWPTLRADQSGTLDFFCGKADEQSQ